MRWVGGAYVASRAFANGCSGRTGAKGTLSPGFSAAVGVVGVLVRGEDVLTADHGEFTVAISTEMAGGEGLV